MNAFCKNLTKSFFPAKIGKTRNLIHRPHLNYSALWELRCLPRDARWREVLDASEKIESWAVRSSQWWECKSWKGNGQTYRFLNLKIVLFFSFVFISHTWWWKWELFFHKNGEYKMWVLDYSALGVDAQLLQELDASEQNERLFSIIKRIKISLDLTI